MKLKALGILMVGLILGVTALSTALLLYISHQFDDSMRSARRTYSSIIVPLREIDANTKNLRFHLYAAFMHNPDESVSVYHTHPFSVHTDTIRAEMSKNVKLWDAVHAAATGMPTGDLSELQALYDAYFSRGMEPGIRAAEARDWHAIVRTVTATLPEYIKFEKALQASINKLQQSEDERFEQDLAQQRHLIQILLVSMSATLIVAIIAVSTTVRNYTSRLRAAMQATEAMATGDLSQHIDPSGHCEASAMLAAIVSLQNAMRRLVGGIHTSSEYIHAAATEVARGNTDLSHRTERQAGSLQETASSMEQMTATVTQNADNAVQANQLAIAASAVAIKGGAVVAQVIETMQSIEGAARRIVDIIAVIDGIAFQTNILALNAAVESARAGEQGRGFAVVASEVRNLAHRSAAAAKEIKDLIADSVQQIDTGTELVSKAGHTMDEIVASVKSVTNIMSEISSASQEQTAGIGQINQTIVQMDDVVQQNAALVEQASAAAMSLQEQAATMTQLIGIFKLGDQRQDPRPFHRADRGTA